MMNAIATVTVPPTPTVVVHVGAGHHSSKLDPIYRAAMHRAIAAARQVLGSSSQQNDAALMSLAAHAVVAAIKVLEDDPALNAGTGSNLTWDGRVECDASIMDSRPPAAGSMAARFGAVGAASGIRYPIEAAAGILAFGSRGLLPGGRVPPMMLAGPGASAFVTSTLDRPDLVCDPDALVTRAAQARHARHMAVVTSADSQPPWHDPLNHDTVGAIVLDSDGNLAAGVSSGGISLKYPGRVGEAAVFGAGVWAQNAQAPEKGVGVGVSCSGVGEAIVHSGLARRVADMVVAAQQEDAKEGDEDTDGDLDGKLREVVEHNAGQGMGLCMLVHDATTQLAMREVVVAHSTPSMGIAVWNESTRRSRRNDGVEYVMSRKGQGRASCVQRIGLGG